MNIYFEARRDNSKVLTDNTDSWHKQIVYYLVPFSLYCCFTNYIYLSAIGALLIVVLPFIVSGNRNFALQKTASNILKCLLFFGALCIFSILITHPSELISFDFYRRDGNFFITFIPLIVLLCTAIDFDVWQIIRNFVYISTFANLIGMALFFVNRTPEYAMFFTAHNAAGGFLGIVVIANFALMCKKRVKWLTIICLLINIVGLYLTDSRGSILPLILAFIFLFVLRKMHVKGVDIIFNVAFFLFLLCFVAYVTSIRGYDVLVNMDQYYLPTVFEDSIVDRLIARVGRGGTIINRLYYLYPKAIYMFNMSPIFGTGMGTFNDIDFNFVGAENIFMLNISSIVENNSSHAHNSFFHIMAENGIVGLSIVVAMLFYMRGYSLSLKDRNLSNLLFVAVNYAILTSFFEHRLFTPAEMLPFVYIFGIVVSKENYNKLLSISNNHYKPNVATFMEV